MADLDSFSTALHHMDDMKPKLLDWIVICCTVLIIGIFSVSAYANPSAPGTVVISAPESEWIFSLSDEGIYAIPGELGDMTIEIRDRQVRVLDSPCREKICIRTGAISRSGAWIACIPSRVFIRIQGQTGGETDATSF